MCCRFLTHTVHCSACRKAYAAMQLFQRLALVAAAVLFFAACAAVSYTGLSAPVMVLGALSAVALAAARRLRNTAQNFVFVDYDEHHISKRSS